MDFEFSEAQRDLAAMVREHPQWTDLAASGVLAATLPESAGGNGFGLLEQCSVLVELGRAMSSAPYLHSIVQAASTVARFGTAEHVDRWVRPALTGSTVLSVALSEENNDDPLSPVTQASPISGGWRLTGAKSLVPPGDLFLVPASTTDGVRLFLVESDQVSPQPQELVDGDTCLLDLSDVEVDASRVLDAAAVSHALHRGVVGLCALQLGVVERALEMTTEYARTRQQFDRPIGSFQAVSQRLADAYIQVEAIRLTLWQAAWRLSEGLPCDTELATAKFWAAEAGHYVAHTAVHIHGGMGIDVSHPLHRYFTAAKRHEFALGGATAHLRHIGAALAATPV
ncbi:acyl-CoA dehydrogenase family protein [Kutzneria sp. CA-103260]|uniref:acyl-CoA dehydrogenase family protein n=1 Tax=Kutzneria sp. CA-103260 TaxID=2802641 RepID=UPI001BA7EAB6|nr:acyl-CoA dehydrogenase family protein [Kutzneria sp. CA-103260]QUQ66380.1 acyl-CoA dehydrogenase [Kutzneria sp. CA-103260]